VSRDGVAGLAVLAASLALFALTLGLKDSPLVPIGPGFYPRIVLGVTAAFALLLVVSDVLAARKRRRAPASASAGKRNHALVAASFGVFAVYAFAMPWLGFRIATFLFVGGLNAVLDPPRGARGWARMLAIALVTTFLAWLVFERWLTVLLPRGRWTDF
jgi:hypothetical protein